MKRRPDLSTYERKRDFKVTPEPPPGRAPARAAGPPSFMVHKHDARRLHYDLRLEMDGALASWAIPKGPSYDPKVRRLAVQTEDHPLEYGQFEGRIPDGEYGAGDSIIWDRGVYETVPAGQGSAMRKKGHVEFVLLGEKLKGRWHLVRTRGAVPSDKAQWILFKGKDEHADPRYDVVAERPESVVSGRRVTRGPTPAAVLQGRRGPLEVLIAVWPPAEPTAAAAPPRPDGYLYERFGEGTRALAGVSRGKATLQSGAGKDLGAAHPRLVAALSRLPVVEAAIDGELVDGGKSLVAHDLLWLDGDDLRARPLEERRELLAEVAARDKAPFVVAPLLSGPAPGAPVLARKRGSPYRGGKSRAWLLVGGSRAR